MARNTGDEVNRLRSLKAAAIAERDEWRAKCASAEKGEKAWRLHCHSLQLRLEILEGAQT